MVKAEKQDHRVELPICPTDTRFSFSSIYLSFIRKFILGMADQRLILLQTMEHEQGNFYSHCSECHNKRSCKIGETSMFWLNI